MKFLGEREKRVDKLKISTRFLLTYAYPLT